MTIATVRQQHTGSKERMETLQNAMIKCKSHDRNLGRCEHAAIVAVKVVAVHEVQRNGLEIYGSAEHKSMEKTTGNQ